MAFILSSEVSSGPWIDKKQNMYAYVLANHSQRLKVSYYDQSSFGMHRKSFNNFFL